MFVMYVFLLIKRAEDSGEPDARSVVHETSRFTFVTFDLCGTVA